MTSTVCVSRILVKKLVVDWIVALPDGLAALPIGFLILASTDTPNQWIAVEKDKDEKKSPLPRLESNFQFIGD
jgi:hypothetical protein